MSSVLAILNVLGLTERKHEGSLLVKSSSAGQGDRQSYVVMFAPYEGSGGALEARLMANEEALREFWSELAIGSDAQRLALAGLIQTGSATIPKVLLTPSQVKRYWPNQKPR